MFFESSFTWITARQLSAVPHKLDPRPGYGLGLCVKDIYVLCIACSCFTTHSSRPEDYLHDAGHASIVSAAEDTR